MQLFEALKTIRDRAADISSQHSAVLLSGFTPLHLKTLLAAELTRRWESGRVALEVGLFGDLTGNLQRALAAPSDATAVVIEWSDLDPRLGWRSSHGWRPERISEVLSFAEARLGQMASLLTRLAGQTTLAVALPTLPLPPLFTSPLSLTDASAATLRRLMASFAEQLAHIPKLRVLDSQQLDRLSPLATRHDAASELRSGYPYQMEHAGVLAEQLARLLRPTPALKGLITDLDNTLWSGIVGDDGVEGVSWDLDHKTHHHALYQELLASLAEAGVLIAVASRNSESVVRRAFERADLVFPAASFFPVEANWGPKSESIRRILKAWNIGPDAVLFVDDSPMEIAEVSAAWPALKCRQFPTGNEAEVLTLLGELRDAFGRAGVTTEDKLRSQSLRAAVELADVELDSDDFLHKADAEITFEWNQPDERAFELINKTNQFNLNGRRLDEADWRRALDDPATTLLTVSYRDRFAPLGKIGVVLGRLSNHAAPDAGSSLEVTAWVLSCRAFSRRIEHSTLAALFAQTGVDRIVFDYQPTDRNGPLQTTLEALLGAVPSGGPVTLDRAAFETHCPSLFAKVTHHEPSRTSRAA